MQPSSYSLRNHRDRPNEHLGRELLELVSMGEGNYGEWDGIKAAWALTGYSLQGNGTHTIAPRRHRPRQRLGVPAAGRHVPHPFLGVYPSPSQLDTRGDLIPSLSPPDIYRQALQL